jgi:hypothetical protein
MSNNKGIGLFGGPRKAEEMIQEPSGRPNSAMKIMSRKDENIC